LGPCRRMKALRFYLNVPKYVFCKLLGPGRPGLYFGRFSNLQLREVPEPTLVNEHWVRVRTLMGGICASDVSAVMLKQDYRTLMGAFATFPVALGHENVGVIAEVGADVQGFQPGDRVNVSPHLSCHARGIEPVCRHCARGEYTCCTRLTEGDVPPALSIGSNNVTGGSWGEYFVAHESQLHKVPDAITNEAAVLADPFACALHGLMKALPTPGDTVIVIGAGVIGLCSIAAVRALGFDNRVIAIARHPFQADLARGYGADEVVTAGTRDLFRQVADILGTKIIVSMHGRNEMLADGAAVVVDCVGTTSTITQALRLADSGGKVVLLGMGFPNGVDWTPVCFRELVIIGSNTHGPANHDGVRTSECEMTYRFIEQGKLDLAPLLTHKYRLTQYRQAFSDLRRKKKTHQVKSVFVFD